MPRWTGSTNTSTHFRECSLSTQCLVDWDGKGHVEAGVARARRAGGGVVLRVGPTIVSMFDVNSTVIIGNCMEMPATS
jgi:hypothetical protein